MAGFLEGSGSNAAVRNMVRSLCELYDLPRGEITRARALVILVELDPVTGIPPAGSGLTSTRTWRPTAGSVRR